MKEINIGNGNINYFHKVNQNDNDLSFNRLCKIQQLIKTQSNLKELCKI